MRLAPGLGELGARRHDPNSPCFLATLICRPGGRDEGWKLALLQQSERSGQAVLLAKTGAVHWDGGSEALKGLSPPYKVLSRMRRPESKEFKVPGWL